MGQTAPQPSQSSNQHASALLEGLEATFGESIDVTARRLRQELTGGVLKYGFVVLDDFLDEYSIQVDDSMVEPAPLPMATEWYKPGPRKGPRQRPMVSQLARAPEPIVDYLPVLEPGENRPIIRRKVADHDTWGVNPRLDPISALLYSKDIILLDPLAKKAPRLLEGTTHDGQAREETEGLSREEWLVRSIEQYSYFAPVIRAGLVEIIPCADTTPFQLTLGGYPLGEIHTREWERQTGRVRDAETMTEMLSDLMLKLRVTARSPGMAHATARPGLEETLVGYYYHKQFPRRRQERVASQDEKTVARLVMLRLNGVTNIRSADLVDVRQEAVFSDVRHAVTSAVSAALDEEELAPAQEAARSVFQELAPAARPVPLGQTLAKMVVPKMVAFGVGTVLSSAVGQWWQGALPIAVETIASEILQDRHDRRARKAQHSLYVALATTAPTTRVAAGP